MTSDEQEPSPGEESRLAGFFPNQGIQAEGAGPGSAQVEEDEAVEHSQLPVINEGDEPLGKMRLEVGHGHLATQNKRHWRGEKPQDKQQPAYQFQAAGNPRKGPERSRPTSSTHAPK